MIFTIVHDLFEEENNIIQIVEQRRAKKLNCTMTGRRWIVEGCSKLAGGKKY